MKGNSRQGAASMQQYEKFCRRLLTEKRSLMLGYGKLCRRLGSTPKEMDKTLMAELGMSGRELLWRLRLGVKLQMNAPYFSESCHDCESKKRP